MDKKDVTALTLALTEIRAVADAALIISQHLLLRKALHQLEPAEWLEESFEEMQAEIDEKTKGWRNRQMGRSS